MGLFTTGNSNVWKIVNLDTGEVLEGDFEAQNVTLSFGSSYGESSALNSITPITQFLHGQSNALTFTGHFFFDPAAVELPTTPAFEGLAGVPIVGSAVQAAGSVVSAVGSAITTVGNLVSGEAADNRPIAKLSKLEEWTRTIDNRVGRPPIVLFQVGSELYQQSVIESVSNITFYRPMETGEVRGCSFSVALKEYTPSPKSIEQVREKPGFSRWHHAKKGDYYELVAAKEYNVPILGDVVRSFNPGIPILSTGVTIKFPSFEGIHREVIAPRSIVLADLNTKEDTPQRALRQQVVDRLASSYTSFVVPEGL